MGQRSQIYVRVNTEDGKKYLTARYYQWNYGERMVSRARHTLEWIDTGYRSYPYFLAKDKEGTTKLKRIMDTNFDYHDVVLGRDIIDEYLKYAPNDDFEQFAFAGQANNDGQLFIDMVVDYEHKDRKGDPKVEYKYAFRTNYEDDWNPMTPEEYMQWNNDYGGDDKDWRNNEYNKGCVKFTERNINYIMKHAKLMTSDEMFEFAHHDYVKDMEIGKG